MRRFVSERSYDPSSFAQLLQQKQQQPKPTPSHRLDHHPQLDFPYTGPTRRVPHPSSPDAPGPARIADHDSQAGQTPEPVQPGPSVSRQPQASSASSLQQQEGEHVPTSTRSISSSLEGRSLEVPQSISNRRTISPSPRASSPPNVPPRAGPKPIPSSSAARHITLNESRGGVRTGPSYPTCDLCSSSQQVLSCRECHPEVRLCSRCISNAPFAHPYPNHHLEPLNKGVPLCEVQREDVEQDEDEESTLVGQEDSTRVEGTKDSAGRQPVLIPLVCALCERRLEALRYECQDCSDDLCPDCSFLHLDWHTLKAVKGPSEDKEARPSKCDVRSDGGRDDVESLSDGSSEGQAVQDDGGEGRDGPEAREVELEETEGDSGRGEDGSGQEDLDHALEANDSGIEDDDTDMDEATSTGDNEASSSSERSDEDSSVDDEDIEDGVLSRQQPALTGEAISAALSKISKVANTLNRTLQELTETVDAMRRDFSIPSASAARQRSATSTARSRLNRSQALNAAPGPQGTKRRGPVRSWLPKEQKRLARMKQKGFSDAQIGRRLTRSTGAVAQQWRKQRLALE